MKVTPIIYMCSALLLLFAGCSDELDDKADLRVGVATNDHSSLDGDTVVVKKGAALDFTFNGSPDNIVFFSGETGAKYEYKDRVEVDASDIVSSRLTFSVWAQYGNAKTAANVLRMMISDSFTGLEKNNFKADSALVEHFDWNELVPQADLPQAPGNAKSAKAYDIDMTPYLGKRIALAIAYQPKDNSAAQPRENFVGMKIVNTMKDGTTSTLYAGNFGFTAVNMMCHHNLDDQRSMTANREYGTVTNNTSGIWNLSDAGRGNFFIHSSGASKALKYGWLVTDLFTINACSPDQGLAIKNISQRLDSYSYTYSKTGLYKAVFIATNANYKYESRVVREVYVRVVD